MLKSRFISTFLLFLTACHVRAWAVGSAVRADDRASALQQIDRLRSNRSYFTASAQLDKLMAKSANDADVLLAAARLHRDMGLLARAEDEYLKVLARKPDLAEGSIALSNIYLQKLDMPKALNYARRAFSSSPRTETRLGLASALLAAGKLGEAQRELDTLLKSDPKNPQVQYSAYELASSLNETDVAQRHLEAAVNMAAARSDWLIELSDLYKESGDYFDARKTLERALVVDPDSIDALNKLAVIYEFYLHDYDQATEAYHRILSIDSDSVSALAGLDRCKVKKNDISGALKYQLRNVFQDLFSLMGKNQSE